LWDKSVFLKELKDACEKKELDYSGVINWIETHIKETNPISYYIALGPSPKFSLTQVDIFILTKDSLRNFELKKEDEKIYSFYTIPLVSFKEALKKEWASAEFTFTQLGGGFIINDRSENIDKLREFAGEVLKHFWRK